MKKLILCSLLGAVIAQAWGFFSWAILPWHMLDFKQFKNGDNVAAVMKAEAQGSGLYTLPNMDDSVHSDEQAMAEWNAKASAGPFAFISLQADGVNPGMGPALAVGFLINIATAAVLFWLLMNSSLSTPVMRTLFIATAGSIGALYPHLSNWNWWHFPFSYCAVGVIDLFLTWALAGFAMVKLSDRLQS